MWKKILIKIGMLLLNFGLERLFNNVDKDGDGLISKEEAYNYVVDKINYLYRKK